MSDNICAKMSDTTDPNVKDKMNNIDWEVFFEDGEIGLIALIKNAKSINGVRKCVDLVIDMLYMREKDALHKKALKARLNDLIPTAQADSSLDPKKTKESIATLLREVKEDRIKGALAYAEQQKVGAVAEEECRIGSEESTESPAPPASGAEAVFVDVFCGVVNERLAVLKVHKAPEGKTLPFILSPDFAAHFQAILRQGFAPVLAIRFKGLLGRAEQEPEEKRKDYIEQEFEGKEGRGVLWEAWQKTWDETIGQTELPDKPKEEKKSFLGLLKKMKKEDTPAWQKNELTLKEWKVKVKRIKNANKNATRIWGSIAAESEDYQPPEDGDGGLLKELFGRSPIGIKKQIDALRQIATQSGNIGRSFDSYQGGKNLDLALLSVCHQNPEIFLDEEACLKQFLAGFKDSQKRSFYPLTSRYLSDHM
jgi:hypothetical protein